jgi:hypothetical protein
MGEAQQFIEENYRVKRDFAFYGKNYGGHSDFGVGVWHWPLSIQERGASLCRLLSVKHSLKRPRSCASVLRCEAFSENARAFTEGRWLFIRVESEQDCCDASHTEVVDSWRRLRLPAHF